MRLEGAPPDRGCPADSAQFARPGHRAGVELYRAHIVRHAFEPHTHEAFGLGTVESGVERFRYRGSEHLAPSDSLVLMNPDELHTGQAETAGGWSYRMLYIDPQALRDISGEPGWWFPQAVALDAARARRVGRLLQGLWSAAERGREPLAFDSALLLLVDELRPHARMPSQRAPQAGADFARVIEHMRAHLDQSLRLEELARTAELSPFHFLRMFKARHHATPQQMLMALRLFAAKERLARGEPAAQVAAAVGLSDQSHLTRSFAQRYGLTPARYQRQVRVG
jgi:AraC-like DNA-binding protein